MNQRLSLKTMQERLVQRLNEAHNQGVSTVWLGVEVGARGCLLPLVQAGEILSWMSPNPVPYTKDWFRGVVNHRGELLGLIDLGLFMSQQLDESAPAPQEERLNQNTRLVGLNKALDVPVVLWVDRMVGLHGPAQFERCDPPPKDAPSWCGQRFIDRQQRVWQEINLVGLCGMSTFMTVAS